jgi:hypothetical protein
LLAGHHEVNSLLTTHSLHHDVLPHHMPKAMEPADQG